MADTGVRGLLYGVSAVNVIIYRRLSSLGGGWQVEKEKRMLFVFGCLFFIGYLLERSIKTKPDSLTNQRLPGIKMG